MNVEGEAHFAATRVLADELEASRCAGRIGIGGRRKGWIQVQTSSMAMYMTELKKRSSGQDRVGPDIAVDSTRNCLQKAILPLI
jgi:hypothetical protein